MTKEKLYIAYGSNLHLEQMAMRCPSAKAKGRAVLYDHELLFRTSGSNITGAVATVEPKEGSSVPVLLWSITCKDEKALDRYEGFPTLYQKKNVEVDAGGRNVSAMIYAMAPGFEYGIPSAFYLHLISEGYRSAGFDLSGLQAACKHSSDLAWDRWFQAQAQELAESHLEMRF